MQFSDDGQSWYAVAYTGQPADWVLGGESGHKDLLVRFGSADGGVSPVVKASIDVDTTGPVTVARSARRAAGGRTALRFSVRDAGSKAVDATLVVKGKGQTRTFDLGRVRTGGGHALVRTPQGLVHVARAGHRPRRPRPGQADDRQTRDPLTQTPPRRARRHEAPLVHGRRPPPSPSITAFRGLGDSARATARNASWIPSSPAAVK